MSISGGERGFDEGGVLQALFQRPFYQRTTVERKYDRKGNMTRETTHSFDISAGDVVVAGIAAGALTLGIFSVAAITDYTKNLPGGLPGSKANAEYVKNIFGSIWAALQNQAGL